MAAGRTTLVIGAGIVGVNVALALAARGRAVTVIDALEPGEMTSAGNAGCIATAEITPVSMPGLVWQVPKMLLDPLGPLTIGWGHLPALAPWLWRFWRAGTPARVEAITTALAALLARSWEDYLPLLREAGLDGAIRRRGTLHVYRSEAAWTHAAYEWDLRRRHGVAFEELDGATLRDLEPALAPVFTRAVLMPDGGHVADPQAIVKGLAAHARARGVVFRRGTVRGFTFAGDRPAAAILDAAEPIPFDEAAIAGGAWSKPLCRAIGYAPPLDTERGYNTTLPNPAVTLNRPVTFAEQSFVASPLDIGLRIGGAVELAGTEAPPNYERSKRLLALAKAVLPGLDETGGREWMGCRPSLPDSLPVISRAPRHPNIYLAFGHGHLGLTEAATTGRLIADFATGVAPPIDPTPYRADRF